MTKHEETILDHKINGLSLRILLTGVAFIVSGVITGSSVYFGLKNEIREGNAKYDIIDNRMDNVEKRVDDHDYAIKKLAEKK